MERRAVSPIIGGQAAEEIPRGITHRQAADVIADCVVAIFIGIQGIDEKRQIERGYGAVSKSVK